MSCTGSGLGPPLCIISSDYHSNIISHVRKLRLRIFTELVVEGEGHTESKWDSNSGSEAKSNILFPQPCLPQHHTFVETILRNQSNSFLSRTINIQRQGDEMRKQTSFPRIWEQILAKLPKAFWVLREKKKKNNCQCRQKERKRKRKKKQRAEHKRLCWSDTGLSQLCEHPKTIEDLLDANCERGTG